ncbi:matrixin family metalloprotease [Actinophytocola xanthii]|uniref:Peptidase M10 metallopeptidase domain-containing protein n=1 Tax=Actinophytocola xanthii TaxID=1912961 RepID=A0A1Q8CYF5_9PSEU|nr:matrixin family metalloprotease [Actinophytocola xanthii]OLF19375.1 hypothetical protein BU204_00125 [Actinophytocola xanthii]
MVRTVLAMLAFAAVATVGDVAVEPVVAHAADDVHVVGEAIIAGPTGAFAASTTAKAAAKAAAPGCDDRSYALSPWRVDKPYQWTYNPKGTPASVAATALGAIQRGSTTVSSGRNRCRTTTRLTTTNQYKGTTTRVAQVSASGTCAGNDGVSVTSWGRLPSAYLAYTCVYYRSNGTVIASDMLIDNSVHAWATTLPARCVKTFDLESVVVHERGHTAGIGHVEQVRSVQQTMSPRNQPCSTTKRLLGAGDLAGLRARYGA